MMLVSSVGYEFLLVFPSCRDAYYKPQNNNHAVHWNSMIIIVLTKHDPLGRPISAKITPNTRLQAD